MHDEYFNVILLLLYWGLLVHYEYFNVILLLLYWSLLVHGEYFNVIFTCRGRDHIYLTTQTMVYKLRSRTI